MIISQETYQDDSLGKPRVIKYSRMQSATMSLEDMITTITDAGYEVRKSKYRDSG